MKDAQPSKGMVAWNWHADKRGIRPIHVDPTTHASVTISAQHHEVHEGHMWHWSHFDRDLDDAEDFDLILVTPSVATQSIGGYGPFIHLATSIFASGLTTITLYEGVSSVVGGTAKTPINRNRNTTNASLVTLLQDPTSYSVVGATTLEVRALGTTGNTNNRLSGSARSNQEWLLKPGTSYAINVEPEVDNVVFAFDMDFYEHYHKDNWDEELVKSQSI